MPRNRRQESVLRYRQESARQKVFAKAGKNSHRNKLCCGVKNEFATHATVTLEDKTSLGDESERNHSTIDNYACDDRRRGKTADKNAGGESEQ